MCKIVLAEIVPFEKLCDLFTVLKHQKSLIQQWQIDFDIYSVKQGKFYYLYP